MTLVEIILLFAALVGHLIFWIAAINRLHSCAIPHWLIGLFSGVLWSCIPAIPLVLYALVEVPNIFAARALLQHPLLLWYLIPCWFVAAYATAERTYELIHRPEQPAALLSSRTWIVDLLARLGKRPVRTLSGKLLTRLPGNQVWQLRVQENTLHLPRMATGLDGLSIAHLSDIHMSGRLDKEFYAEIVELTNELDADIIAITGDLFDNADCWEWIPDTLARLRARYGVYYILGNHDLRVDSTRTRQLLNEAGLRDLGGRWLELPIHGCHVALAGNELPWFSPAADMESCPHARQGAPLFRLLLAHAPDQIDWAQRHNFDLMLAGHTHGGQIRLPLLGAIVAPSRLGTKFSGGTFYAEPTVLHVSRGVSGLTPLRWNCPPELTRLVLRCGTAVEDSAASLAQASA
jgi:predicted MPP superfamily phosphohydrolase